MPWIPWCGSIPAMRFTEVLESCAGSSAEVMVKAVERRLNEFHRGQPRDDIAFVVLRVPG